MNNILQDFRYGLRMLAKNPAFTLVAVLTLALGIGANTAIFSVMNAVILRFLPVSNPQELVYLHTTGNPSGSSQTGEGSLSFTMPIFERLRTETRVFASVMAYVPLSTGKVAVRYGEEPEEAQADMVSGNFFSGLGVQPARGQTFTVRDETQHSQVAVLSYGYWSRRFGRNPSIIGETLYIKGVPFTVIGIGARDFEGVESGVATDLWIPLQNRPDLTAWGQSAQDGDTLYGSPNWWCLMMIGRLAPGISQRQALAQLAPIFERAAYEGSGKRDPKEHPPQLYFSDARGIGSQRNDFEQPIGSLMGMVGLVLVIACGNVAMLLVARNSARQREFCLRMALGSGRWRLFCQLLTESLLLVAGGGILGWLFAVWATKALAAWSELKLSLAPDFSVLLFTLGVSILAALLFGLAPLRNAVGTPIGLVLKTSAATTNQDRRKVRGGQVVVALQMAMCLVLLVCSGLLVRTLRNLETTDLGMRPTGLLVFGITPPQTLATDPEVHRFYQELSARLRALPGVESATLMQNRIGSGWSNNTSAYVDGRRPGEGNRESALRWNAVGPDYFHVLGMTLLLGRDFTDADSAAAPKSVVVSQTFAERYLPKLNPLGHHVSMSSKPDGNQYTIIGVAADSKYTGVRESKRPTAYFPYTQIKGTGTMHYELRTQGNPAALLSSARHVVHDFGPDLPLLQPMTQQEQFNGSFSQERLFARLSMFFGLLAALLVATGLYGTLAYRVSRRTAEIGVRMAVGAQRHQILGMVLLESLVVSLAGIIIGLPIAFGSGRLLRSMLFDLTPGDPITFVCALLGLTLVALVASLIPARRAASVDPMVALRYE